MTDLNSHDAGVLVLRAAAAGVPLTLALADEAGEISSRHPVVRMLAPWRAGGRAWSTNATRAEFGPIELDATHLRVTCPGAEGVGELALPAPLLAGSGAGLPVGALGVGMAHHEPKPPRAVRPRNERQADTMLRALVAGLGEVSRRDRATLAVQALGGAPLLASLAVVDGPEVGERRLLRFAADGDELASRVEVVGRAPADAAALDVALHSLTGVPLGRLPFVDFELDGPRVVVPAGALRVQSAWPPFSGSGRASPRWLKTPLRKRSPTNG